MTRYRRHAIVAILIVAAIITPTTDVFTLLIVSLPIWLLYEISILVVNLMRR
jgi:sec-independent protein translocase protein TatC